MTLFATLRRAALFLALVATPLAAMPSVNAGNGAVIEAPAAKKMGAGFVLLVSLQRAQ